MFKTKVLSAIVFAAIISTSYFYGSALATSSITQQSSQSSITSNGSSVTSSRIESSTGGAGLQEDMQLAGKIADSQLNLTTGSVEAVLFGDWTLESSGGEASFAANFTQTLQSDNSTIDYRVGNITVTSVQKINDNIVLSGSADVASSNATQTARGAPIAVMVVDKELVAIGFGGEASALFGGMPVTGVVSN